MANRKFLIGAVMAAPTLIVAGVIVALNMNANKPQAADPEIVEEQQAPSEHYYVHYADGEEYEDDYVFIPVHEGDTLTDVNGERVVIKEQGSASASEETIERIDAQEESLLLVTEQNASEEIAKANSEETVNEAVSEEISDADTLIDLGIINGEIGLVNELELYCPECGIRVTCVGNVEDGYTCSVCGAHFSVEESGSAEAEAVEAAEAEALAAEEAKAQAEAEALAAEEAEAQAQAEAEAQAKAEADAKAKAEAKAKADAAAQAKAEAEAAAKAKAEAEAAQAQEQTQATEETQKTEAEVKAEAQESLTAEKEIAEAVIEAEVAETVVEETQAAEASEKIAEAEKAEKAAAEKEEDKADLAASSVTTFVVLTEEEEVETIIF